MSNQPICFPSWHSSTANLSEKRPSLSKPEDAVKFTPSSIGGELYLLRRELMACGDQLRKVLPEWDRSLIDDALQVLAHQRCRIAVVGQVKAGKSSLINAVLKKPGLLPANVNLGTTAVTSLHFAHIDAPENIAVEFTFFDADEWTHLVQGGGRIRELTQRLVPGFDVELLEKHVKAMRIRSEHRLGEVLQKLLGTKHTFPSLSAEILENYVCSGSAILANGRAPSKGLYCDVTKRADLYFSANELGFPTTIIDTPGTNDPFLVRDEITRRALDMADIYIVVSTARQALSPADIALLRILRALHKDQIALFINGIDDLADVAREIPVILRRVRMRLRREFPAADIPLIVGSASWANAALQDTKADLDPAVTEKIKAYAKYLSEQDGANPSEHVSSTTAPREQLSKELLLCSGLPALLRVLSSLMTSSHASHVLRQIASTFTELTQITKDATREQLQKLDTSKTAIVPRQQYEDELRSIHAQISQNERLMMLLHRLLIDLQTRAEKIIFDGCETMHETLRDIVLNFAEMQCNALRAAISQGRSDNGWKCQTAPLRNLLEERYIKIYCQAGEQFRDLEGYIFMKLRQVLDRMRPNSQQPRDEGGELAITGDPPSLSPSDNVMALDFDEPWWKKWWARGRSDDELIEELNRRIREEFYPVVDSLIRTARLRLKEQQAALVKRSTVVYVGLVQILQEHGQARLVRTRELTSIREAANNAERVQQEREAQVAAMKQNLATIEVLSHRLAGLDRACAVKFG
jgi:GTPase Era involved in 16S rRNA processing